MREQAWPEVTNADELHDAMHAMGVITEQEGASAGWTRHLDELIDARRATRLHTGVDTSSGSAPNVCRWSRRSIRKAGSIRTSNRPAEKAEKIWQREEAITDLVRGRLQSVGPITARDMAATLGLSLSEINIALIELESEGFVLRGRFTEEASAPEAVQAG